MAFNWSNLFGGLGSMFGAGINSATQMKINQENIKMQKEFAQNGIQWKVQDAEKAGIHPAIALGANTYQATPSSVAPDVGSGVSGAFKHFGSAIDSFVEDKEEERNLQLENMKLQNEKEKLEIEKMRNANNPNHFSGLNPKAYTPAPYTTTYETAGGKMVIALNKDLMDYASENKFQDVNMNALIVKEMEEHAHNLNAKSLANGSNKFYIPASLDEIGLNGGLPFLWPVEKKDWQKYVDDRIAVEKKNATKARKEKELEARRRRIGTSADDIPFLHGYRSYGF